MRSFLSPFCFLALLLPGVGHASATQPDPAQSQRAKIDLAVSKKADWLADARLCPATVMPRAIGDWGDDACKKGLAQCLAKCESGDANSCYSLAIAMQNGGKKTQTSEALHQRACKLGIASGCTNHAAGMYIEAPKDPAVLQCALHTYERTCAAGDPWGCTMYALHYTYGMGVKADYDVALRALAKSCRYGEEDDACRRARDIRKTIETARNESGASK